MAGDLLPIGETHFCQEPANMVQISNYCKAYTAEALRHFQKWEERASPLVISTTCNEPVDGRPSKERAEEIFFLHDDYIVTADIFHNQSVVFDTVTDEWKEFCRSVLQFEPSGGDKGMSNPTGNSAR
jgi:hypothetical protein